MDEIRSAYPLDWPVGWHRTPPSRRSNGKFNKKEMQYRDGQSWPKTKELSVTDAIQRILREFELRGIEKQDVVISTNVRTRLDGLPRGGEREPDDPGAAVYWRDQTTEKKPTRCMAIDRYTTVADNLAAVAATLEAMRAIDRHGSAEVIERAYSGFLALPEKASQPWRDVLGITGTATRELILAKSRDLLLANNPDQGGDRDKYEAIIEARKRGLAETAVTLISGVGGR